MLNNLKLSFILTTLKCTKRTLKVHSQVLIKGKTSLFDASEMLIATDNISVFQENNRNYIRTVQKMRCVCRKFVSHSEYLFHILDFFGFTAATKSC